MNMRLAAACALAALLMAPDAGWTKKKDKDNDPWDAHGQPLPPGQAKKPGGGPPPWAPAHGYRAKQKYRYYPRYNVYQDPASGLFFSFQAGAWVKGDLPPDLNPHRLGRGYTFEGDLDEPYRGNSSHKKKYKP
ncbi:MAG: hypothetical protein ACLGSA_14775 [Acidobacteriota bacterium]